MKPFESFLAPQLEQYVAYRKSLGYAKQSLKPSLLALDRYVKEKGVQEQLLPPSFFLQFRADLKKRPSTVNTILSGVRSFFQFLVRQGIYEENPLKDVPPLPKTYFIPFIFSPEQVEELGQGFGTIGEAVATDDDGVAGASLGGAKRNARMNVGAATSRNGKHRRTAVLHRAPPRSNSTTPPSTGIRSTA